MRAARRAGRSPGTHRAPWGQRSAEARAGDGGRARAACSLLRTDDKPAEMGAVAAIGCAGHAARWQRSTAASRAGRVFAGRQFSHAWSDEIAKWPLAELAAWDNLAMALRDSATSRGAMATTTPRPTALLRPRARCEAWGR